MLCLVNYYLSDIKAETKNSYFKLSKEKNKIYQECAFNVQHKNKQITVATAKTNIHAKTVHLSHHPHILQTLKQRISPLLQKKKKKTTRFVPRMFLKMKPK